jgi:hypothetical protein
MTESPFYPARSDALDKGRVKVGRCKNVFSRDSIIQCQPERRAEYLVRARILSCRLQVQASLPYLSKLWARIWGPRDPFLPHLSLLFSPDPYLIHHAQRGVSPGYALTLLYAVLW